MKLFKNTPRKLIYLVTAFFFIYLILQMLMLFLAVGVMSTGIEFGQKTFFGDLIWALFRIISFPILNLSEMFPSVFLNFGWTLWILNSALWSLGFYLIIRRFLKTAKK